MGDEEVRKLAHAILARDEYARFRPSPVDSGLLRLIEQLREWLDALPDLMTGAPVLYWSLLIGLMLAAVLLTVHIVWTIQQALRIQAPAPVHAALSPTRDFAEEARSLAQRGAFLEASHRLLLASLAHAARARLLELQPQDSNPAVCRKLAQAPLPDALRGRLADLIARTDAAWFGHREQDRGLFEAWQSAHRELSRYGR